MDTFNEVSRLAPWFFPLVAALYGAVVGDNVHLGPLSLVMKGESLPAGSRWHGCPAAPASR